MRSRATLLGAVLAIGLPAFSQTFQLTYGPGNDGSLDSANLTLQATLIPSASIDVWDVTSITGTWTSGKGTTAGQIYQVVEAPGTEIFGVPRQNNPISSSIYDLNFYAGPYYVTISGLSFGNPPIEREYVFTPNGGFSPNYPDAAGGTYAVQGKLIAPPAPFQPSDAVFLLGGVGFVAMMWRKGRTQPAIGK